jgi:hypothetical protein
MMRLPLLLDYFFSAPVGQAAQFLPKNRTKHDSLLLKR